MDRRSLISTGDGADLSGERRASRSARYARQIRVIKERRTMTTSTSGGLTVREATERRWARLSMACWFLEARTERPVRLLRTEILLPEVVTLGGRGTWAGARRYNTIGPKAPSVPGDRRDSVGDVEGDQGGNMAVSKVDAEMSAAKAGA